MTDNLERYRIAEELLCVQLGIPRDALLTFTLDNALCIQDYHVPQMEVKHSNVDTLKGMSFEQLLFTRLAPGDWPFLKENMRKHPDRYHLADLLIRISDRYVLAMFCVSFTTSAELAQTHIIGVKKHYRDMQEEEKLRDHIDRFKTSIRKNHLFHRPPAEPSEEDRVWLAQIEEMIETTTPAPTIRELADHVGLSQTKLKRVFKRVKGTTVHQYLLTYMVNKIKVMLEDSNVPIKTIAATLRYDLPQLNRMFKRKTGVSPQSYRQQLAKKNVENDNTLSERVND